MRFRWLDTWTVFVVLITATLAASLSDASLLSKRPGYDASAVAKADFAELDRLLLTGTGSDQYVMQHAAERLHIWRQAAELGLPEAQFLVGASLTSGASVPKDTKAGWALVQSAANQGLALAVNKLGLHFHRGDIVPKNYDQGIRHFRVAADLGCAVALRNLGCCYILGLGVAEDPAKGIRFYKKALQMGDCGAGFCLGVCYLGGRGVGKDRAEGFRLIQNAAKQGVPLAKSFMADWLSHHAGDTE